MTDGERYEAVLKNDENYDGVFFYGVRTTGIFCRPSCPSKPPKKENICFFECADEAIEKGFRPCKRCRSDLLSYRPMEEIAGELKDHLQKLYALETSWSEHMQTFGLSERRMVDIFKEHYGITPKAYVDGLRLEQAKKMLTETDMKIIDIAASSGFGSLSTFNRFFKEHTGKTPQTYRKTEGACKAEQRICLEESEDVDGKSV